MIGTPLLVGPKERVALQQLRQFAASRPVQMVGLLERLKKPKEKRRHMARMTEQTIDIPLAYAVTFSIELGHPCGAARHMSMSVKRDGRLPRPEAVWMVAEELGFVGALDQCTVWLEELQGHGQAVNVVQPLTAGEGTA